MPGPELPPARAARRGRRAGLAALRTPPWLRAPLLLARQPATLLALAGAAAVLAGTAAAPVLFAGDVRTAAVQRQDEAACPDDTDPLITANAPLTGTSRALDDSTVDDTALFASRTQLVDAAAAKIPDTLPVQLTLNAQNVLIAGTGAFQRVTMVGRPDVESQIHVVTDTGGRGVFVPSDVAALEHITPGSTLGLTYDQVPSSVRVRGTYTDLSTTVPLPRQWCGLASEVTQLLFSDSQPNPLIVGDLDVVTPVLQTLRVTTEARWRIPVDRDGLTLARTERVAAALPPLQKAVQSDSRLTYSGDITGISQRAAAISGQVQRAAAPVSTASAGVALLLVAGAGGFWLRRRTTEIRLLESRGVSPALLGLKAVLEVLPAVVVGAAAGFVAARLIVPATGPASLVEPGTTASAVWRTVLVVAGGLLLVALVAAQGSRRISVAAPPVRRGRGVLRGLVRLLPVELALVGIAVWVGANLAPAPLADPINTSVPPVDRGLIAFPALLLLGVGLFLVRIGRLVLLARRRRRTSARTALPVWLAGRRMTAAPAASMTLLAAALVSIGVVLYAGVLSASARATVDAKANVAIGSRSRIVLATQDEPDLGHGFRPAATAVRRVQNLLVSGSSLEMLGINPSTYPGAAAWDSSFSSTSLSSILKQLQAPGAAVPVVAVGQARFLPSSGAAEVLSVNGPVQFTYQVVATAKTMPGDDGSNGTFMTAIDRIPKGVAYRIEVWSPGSLDQLQQALAARHIPVSALSLDRDSTISASSLLPVIWTFGYLEALGAVTALIVLGGLLLHVEGRQRGQALSFALAARMGLSKLANVTALVAELGVLLLAGAAVGGVVALIAGDVVHSHLDPAPGTLPAPLLRYPLATVLTALAGLVVAAALGALVGQRSASRARPAELLRD